MIAATTSTTTLAIYIGAACLASLSLMLIVLAVRRVVFRQTEVVRVMLDRYDDRLASFAQTLNDALSAQRLASELALGGEDSDTLDAHHALLRTLELAAERTAADAAIAVVSGASGDPTLASIRLSQDEATHVGRIGVPDYRGARAIQVSFNGETAAPPGSRPVRSGLFVSLLGEDASPSTIAVLTRSPDRSFSESDIEGLEEVVAAARPALERTLELREPDLVPELDSLTELFDRQSFQAVLDREIARARLQRYPLTLLVADVDRLTTMNARIGRLAADEVLAGIAGIIRETTGRSGLPFRVGGGRYAVLIPGGLQADAERMFGRLREALDARPSGEEGEVTLSAGVAELTHADDAGTFVARANGALTLAKQGGRGTLAGASPG